MAKEKKKKKKHELKTDEELKELAQEMYRGEIFCDRQVNRPQDVEMVFIPLCLMDNRERANLRRRKVNFIYEYMSKAGPRSINGNPTFMTCRVLTEPETKRLFHFYEKITKAVATSLEEDKTNGRSP